MINKYSGKIKKCMFFAIIIVAILSAYFIMVRYEVEGEKTMPFYIQKILVMSTVNATQSAQSTNVWDLDVSQNNDLYIYIEKLENVEDILKNVTVENFNVIQSPNKGKVRIYRPTGELSKLYTYSEQDYINDKIEFEGSSIDNLKALEVSNQGGIIGIRIATDEIGKYISDNDSEISYDSSLLTKIGVNEEDIKFSISFDIIIGLESDVKYKGTISMDLPSEALIKNGSSKTEITDFNNVVFKRIK